MKVAVSASGASLDSPVDPRFGRCPYFIIVDTETMKFEAIQNTSQYTPMGAGIQAAQTVASKGVEAVITGNVGPNAYQALTAAGITIITGAAGTVREAIERYKSGQLKAVSSPQIGFGMGYGMGWGRRGGGMGGYGMGRARGQMPMISPAPPPSSTQPSEDVESLKERVEALQRKLEEIKRKLREIS